MKKKNKVKDALDQEHLRVIEEMSCMEVGSEEYLNAAKANKTISETKNEERSSKIKMEVILPILLQAGVGTLVCVMSTTHIFDEKPWRAAKSIVPTKQSMPTYDSKGGPYKGSFLSRKNYTFYNETINLFHKEGFNMLTMLFVFISGIVETWRDEQFEFNKNEKISNVIGYTMLTETITEFVIMVVGLIKLKRRS